MVPWARLIDVIEPHHPKSSSKGGQPHYPLEAMLRIHPMQQWYVLGDPAFTQRSRVGRRPLDDALIEVPTMWTFAGINLISDRIPDETTILSFRHPLKKHNLGQANPLLRR